MEEQNILQQAHEIVYNRSEEKERNYGDFFESMRRMALLYSTMTGETYNVKNMYMAMVALKLSREAFKHKEDNILDAIAYLASMNDYLKLNQNFTQSK